MILIKEFVPSAGRNTLYIGVDSVEAVNDILERVGLDGSLLDNSTACRAGKRSRCCLCHDENLHHARCTKAMTARGSTGARIQ